MNKHPKMEPEMKKKQEVRAERERRVCVNVFVSVYTVVC